MATRFQLVSTLDIVKGDEKKVGYYAGLIVSYCRSFSRGLALLNDRRYACQIHYD